MLIGNNNSIIEAAALATTPLIYKAVLTQSSTNAPVATIISKTIVGTIVWAYSAEGVFTGTLTGAFTANKLF